MVAATAALLSRYADAPPPNNQDAGARVGRKEQVAVCPRRSSGIHRAVIGRLKRRSGFGRNDFLSPFPGNAARHFMSYWTEDHKRLMHF